MDSMPVTIKNAKNGKGVFASKEFLPGQIVYQVRGKLIDTDTIDYSTIVADDDVIDRTIPYEMICNCGESNCRRIIGNFSSLPKELKDRYLEANAVPVYIQEVSRI